MTNLTQQIKTRALNSGFHKIGITYVKQPGKSTFLKTWLQKKYHGTMTWMKDHRSKRMDITEFVPDARSVICVAHNYFTDYERSNTKDTAKISRYAWGRDYHKIMKKKLKNLLKDIQEINPEIEGRLCVDTAPIMEKLWAAQAGIGWQGKHTNIITREFGSWVFLGEIIINETLEYDLPATDMCGSCTKCIDACPTRAIIAPYRLDATRCIAYLTIEYWDKPIPQEFSGKFDNYIFGCDICQEVCPWNKFQKVTDESGYQPPDENINPDLYELEQLSETEFNLQFNKSPVRRTKWQNFIRNIRFVKD